MEIEIRGIDEEYEKFGIDNQDTVTQKDFGAVSANVQGFNSLFY